MTDSLYRPEALQHAGQRYLGEPSLDTMRPGLWLVVLLSVALAAMTALVTFTEFSSRQVVRGQVDERTINDVIAFEFGYLATLNVREGDAVEAGEILGLVTNRLETGAGVTGISEQLTLLAQLEASARTAFIDARHYADVRVTQLEQLQVLAEADIGLQVQKVAALDAQVEKTRGLHEKGYLSGLNYLQFRQSLITEKQALNTMKERAARLVSDRVAVQNGLEERSQGTEQKLAEISLRRSELKRIHAEMLERQTRELIATTAGTVSRIDVLEGGTLVPGQVILQISGQHPWSATITLASSSLAHLEKGTRLQLAFDAYPADQYGRMEATVLGISAITRGPRQTRQTDNDTFMARLDLQPSASASPAISITPGMTFTTQVITANRTLLAWLLYPLTDNL